MSLSSLSSQEIFKGRKEKIALDNQGGDYDDDDDDKDKRPPLHID